MPKFEIIDGPVINLPKIQFTLENQKSNMTIQANGKAVAFFSAQNGALELVRHDGRVEGLTYEGDGYIKVIR